MFAAQETTEGMLFAGHASGIASVLGAGGWLALPLAMLFGALCTVLDGGLAKLEALVALVEPGARRRPASCDDSVALSWVLVPLASLPLAFGLARRPPPLVC